MRQRPSRSVIFKAIDFPVYYSISSIRRACALSALKRYALGVLITISIAIVDFASIYVRGYSVEPVGVADAAKAQLLLLILIILLFHLPRLHYVSVLAKSVRCHEVAVTLSWVLLLINFGYVTLLLSYLGVTLAFPLVDGTLVHIDRSIGFDWLLFYKLSHRYNMVATILELSYKSVAIQPLMIVSFLGLTRRYNDLSEFVLYIIISAVLMIPIATLFPASSTFLHFGISDTNTASTVSYFYPLRNGSLKLFDINSGQGLVSMPSYHTVLAIGFVYALRRVKIILYPALLLNMVMILSTPTVGGHYLADIFGGGLLSVMTIIALRFMPKEKSF